jgi:hypothetical protein
MAFFAFLSLNIKFLSGQTTFEVIAYFSTSTTSYGNYQSIKKGIEKFVDRFNARGHR